MKNTTNNYNDLLNELAEAKSKIDSLAEASNNFNLLINSSDNFVWKTNKDLELIYVSPSVKSTLGYTDREFLRKLILEIVPPESKTIIENALTQRKEGRAANTSKKWVTQIFNKNGILVWIETTTHPILSTNGVFEGVLAISRDISEQVAIERKMQETEVNLVAQIENTSDVIWSIDDAYCVKTLNSNFKTSFKIAFGVELAPGVSIINSLPEPFREIWKKRYDRVLLGEHYTVIDNFEFDGVPQFVEVNFNPIVFKEKVIGVSVFSRNITAQKISEKELIESTANLSSLIENTEARIWSIDTDLNIISINNNFKHDFFAAFGVNLEKGSYALENVPQEIIGAWKDRYERVLKGEQISITDKFNIENVPQFVEVSMNPIRVNEKIIGATCFSRDITKQKIAEIALAESEKRYKSLVANLPSTAYRCFGDNQHTMTFLSAEITNLTGYNADDFIGNKKRNYTSIIHPEDVEYVELMVQEKIVLKQSFTIEYRVIHKNGNVRWVQEQGRGNFNEKGILESIDGVISDITLRKLGEQELQNSELKFRILSDASIDMMSLNTSNEILRYISKALHKRLPNTIIITNSVDERSYTTEVINMVVLNKNLLHKAIEFIGFNPIGRKYKLEPILCKIFKKSKLTQFEGGLYEFSSGQFPKTVANVLQKMFNINEIHTIGISRENHLFAALHFFTLNSEKLTAKNFIESFINLAGIVLQRQQLMEALHQSEDKFRSIFENTGSIIYIETEKNILLTNKAFQETFGYTQMESKTLNPADLIHPLDKEKISLQTKKRLKGEEVPKSYQLHAIDKTFNEKWIDIVATIIDYDGQKAVLVVGSDITERKKADLQLNKFSTGIMNSPSSILITDINGTIEYVNPFFTEFTGYTYEEAVGSNPNLLNSGRNPKEIYVDMWNTILKGEVWNGELLNKKKNGQFFWEIARIAPIFNDNGIITSFIAIKEDITERKRTLELIEQSERDLRDINAKKDKFFSIIAHDLRSPFSGLAGLTEILKNSIRELSEEQVDTYLDLINQSTQNIFKLLENLLSWAKTQTGKIEFSPTRLNLYEIVNETVSVINISAKNKNITINVSIEPDTKVNADENMLNTVIRNLISNAIKYTHNNGYVQVFSEIREINKRKFSVIGVKDNGVGIPANKQNKIFNIEDNYTTNGTGKEKGTGLGLILCKEFVEKHNGRIWCESQENQGSTFYFSLPFN
jgi:PAS domain S-box-containing protein